MLNATPVSRNSDANQIQAQIDAACLQLNALRSRCTVQRVKAYLAYTMTVLGLVAAFVGVFFLPFTPADLLMILLFAVLPTLLLLGCALFKYIEREFSTYELEQQITAVEETIYQLEQAPLQPQPTTQQALPVVAPPQPSAPPLNASAADLGSSMSESAIVPTQMDRLREPLLAPSAATSEVEISVESGGAAPAQQPRIRDSIRGLLQMNLAFFRDLGDDEVDARRHEDPEYLAEYNRRFGMVLCT